ncbi:MAG TPA: glycosyltransferase family 2 protein [Longimicrobiales bacterium]|nr:glycosyltransferase family 2 protein [Longimicrobiales bacterium]
MTLVVLTLPWLWVIALVLLAARLPRELPEAPASRAHPRGAPLVSVIVPARNEAANIERCVRSLAASRYAPFEVIVVDDRSEDDTARIVRGLDRGAAESLRLVEGAELPGGWLGKPWACAQGAAVARGSLLLFTDADTTHGPELLPRAVAALAEERADLLTVVGRQRMETFWERLVQPQIFMVMLLRFPRVERSVRNASWRDALANGQFMLFGREAYAAVGGHGAVKADVVEDLGLAQRVKRAGLALRIRSAEGDLETRMYRSLGELVAGWTKNIVTGGLRSVPAWTRPAVPAIAFGSGVVLWLLPPAALTGALLAALSGGTAPPLLPALLAWSAALTAASALFWAVFTRRMGAPAAYGLLYPLGAAVAAWIFLRSWVRGRRIEWKGRRYVLPPVADPP